VRGNNRGVKIGVHGREIALPPGESHMIRETKVFSSGCKLTSKLAIPDENHMQVWYVAASDTGRFQQEAQILDWYQAADCSQEQGILANAKRTPEVSRATRVASMRR
jgi:hypothetical protein